MTHGNWRGTAEAGEVGEVGEVGEAGEAVGGVEDSIGVGDAVGGVGRIGLGIGGGVGV